MCIFLTTMHYGLFLKRSVTYRKFLIAKFRCGMRNIIKHIKHVSVVIIVTTISSLLSACKLIDAKGVIALQENKLLLTATLLMLVIVIPVILLTLFFAWRYRASNHKATYAPEWAHSTLLEIIWWFIPCVIIAILATITWISSHTLDPYHSIYVVAKDQKTQTARPVKPITIQVIALDWKWLFIYPEQNIATINFIQFPVNVPVEFFISAEGAMNSFSIPQLAGQVYAMAGMQTKLHLITDVPGDYKGFSANFSGDGFSDMKFIARASSQAEFEQWVKDVKKSPATLTTTQYKELTKPSIKHAVSYFSAADPQLFNNVVMKVMMPMDESACAPKNNAGALSSATSENKILISATK